MFNQYLSKFRVDRRLSSFLLAGLFLLSVGIAPVRSQIVGTSQVTQEQIKQVQRTYKAGLHRQACEMLMRSLNTTAEICDPEKGIGDKYFRLVSDAIYKQSEVLMQATLAQQAGDLMRTIGKLDESRKFLHESLKITNNLPAAARGVVLLSLGNTEQAYARRIANIEESTDQLIRISLRCSNKVADGKSEEFYEEALECYEQAAASDPSQSSSVWLFANLNLLNLEVRKNQSVDLQSTKFSRVIKQINELNQPNLEHEFIYASVNLANTLLGSKKKSLHNTSNLSEITQIFEIAKRNLKSQCIQNIDNNKNEGVLNPSNSSLELIVYHLLTNGLNRADCSENKSDKAYVLGRLGYLYKFLAKQYGSKDDSILLSYAQDSTEQALLLTQPANFPHSAYLWQAQLGDIFAEKNEYTKAIPNYEGAISTLKNVRNDIISVDSNIQFSFQEDVEPVYRKLVDLLLRNPTQENLDKARKFLQLLQKAELENFLKCSLQSVSQKSIDELIDYKDIENYDKSSKNNKRVKAALIYPILLEDRIEVILKLPNSKELLHHQWKLPQSEQNKDFSAYVESKLQEFNKGIAESSPDINKLQNTSREIYDWLIAPLEDKLKDIDTLIFLPDISFRNVPLGALVDKAGNYLIKKYAVATTLGLNLVPSQSNHTEQLKILFLGLSKTNSKEFPDVIKLLKVLKSTINTEDLQDTNFTIKNLETKLKTSRASIVHIATHGQFSSQPNQTYIEASDETISAGKLSSLLQGQRQTNPQEISLLTLAACETAAGDKRAALGLAGVAIRSGARSTLATLWKVDASDNTANLLIDFYRELKQGKPKAQALQSAQINLIEKLMKSEDESERIPYYWAAFTLLGDWQ